jgi:hypothetical protein
VFFICSRKEIAVVQRSFGSADTLKKLETIADYLHFYTTALTKKFRLTYF